MLQVPHIPQQSIVLGARNYEQEIPNSTRPNLVAYRRKSLSLRLALKPTCILFGSRNIICLVSLALECANSTRFDEGEIIFIFIFILF